MNNVVDRKTRNRNRRNLILLVLVFCLPMIVAWLVLQNIDSLKPAGSRNFGQLIQPPRPLMNFELEKADGERLDLDAVQGQWSVFYFGQSDCDALCQETVSKIHQARLAQGKEMRRLRLYYITSDAVALNEATQSFLQPFWSISVVTGEVAGIDRFREQFAATGSLPDEAGRIFVVDPLGNIMMTYSQTFVVRDLLKDLEHLLKYSQIG